ncbi:Aldose 1-epimerase [Thermoanaerobacterium xylanolyticum LX-11]|uniref:Aldose 1-epimerase n=1 Tax=Thermoanaerobacterium xylanolyticum (strain ATCC 49914 / DSM 7097 / LX-11) TaxID=858215 RepID=F6BJZ9_THEXL|nr:aldose 1-epimerase [Thermoanaerobacterium xylanolyticum]AEF18020.1 Aldose 1-epimerase [Thermoanaerobacterium xylanolyticum LX-11]
MYKVEKYMDKFETYRLYDLKSNSFFEVVPERGGIITRYVWAGQDILYLDKETLYNTEKNIRGGIPILFPICGYLKDEKYTIDGREYNMKQHGIARLYKWDVVKTSADDSASITLKFTSSSETREIYPFDFELIFTYILKNGMLTIEQQYVNKSEKNMIFYSGFHPYFYIENKDNASISVDSDACYDAIDKKQLIFDGEIDFKKTEVNLIFEPKSNECSILDKKRSMKVILKYDEVFKYVVVWALHDKEFICVEPWMAKPNSMNTKEDIKNLKPGDELKAVFSIRASME